MKRIATYAFALAGLLAQGCKSSPSTCQLNDPNACSSGEVCEPVQGGKPQCFPPVELSGQVYDLSSKAGISGAQVVALDLNGSPLGTTAVSGADGGYVLRVPSTRTDAGVPLGTQLQLAAQAQNYQPFPSGVRVSIPIDTSGATSAGAGKPYAVDSGLVNIGLTLLPSSDQGRPSVSGAVRMDGGQMGIVVSLDGVDGGMSGGTAVAAANGDFTVFNVPAGSYAAQAYTQGMNFTPKAVGVASANVTGVEISPSNTAPATLSGDIILRRSAVPTDVELILADTFNSAIYSGVSVPGLRVTNASGNFSIAGVPDGTYVVLAANQTPGDVRDPANTGNTAIPTVTVQGGQVSANPQFAVTTSVTIVSPGAGSTPDTASTTPTLTWASFSSAGSYDVSVFDAQGVLIWGPATQPASATSVVYGGPALTPGSTYQWRVTALATGGTPLSTSEDLRGIFVAK